MTKGARVAMIGLLLGMAGACDDDEAASVDLSTVVDAARPDSAVAGGDGGGACEAQDNRYQCFPTGTVCSDGTVTGIRIYPSNLACPSAGVCCYFTE
jgi:hypothetical protein